MSASVPSQREEMRSPGSRSVKRALPEHGGACFGGGARFVQQVRLLQPAFWFPAVSARFDHLPGGSLGLFGKCALQFNQRFAGARVP